jgi:hypothetical protein
LPTRLRTLAQLMYKLWMELGDGDFAKIFDDPRIRGLD